MGAMSFGEKANPLEAVNRMSDVSFEPAERDKKYSQSEMVSGQRDGYLISMVDIQEVKDKVPASPISSTEKSSHFK